MIKRISLILTLSAGLIFPPACVKQPLFTVHPGAVNTADSVMYDTILTAQTTIEGLKSNIGQYPEYKDQLNTIILTYNNIQAAYKVYHTAALTNANTDATDLNNMVKSLMLQIGALTSHIKGGK